MWGKSGHFVYQKEVRDKNKNWQKSEISMFRGSFNKVQE